MPAQRRLPTPDELVVRAEQNFGRHLAANPYPGRGLVIGRLSSGAWVQVYWIMGRSANSRNRRFVVEGSSLRTEARDPAQVEDPTNIIYEAMLELPNRYIVSNGDHTRTMYDALAAGRRFDEALATREREDDAPNYTPRIAGLLDLEGAPTVELSILRANAANPSLTDRTFWRPATPPPGLGYGITTYRTDGNPLPPYAGDPLWLPLPETAEETADQYWAALDLDNRISLAAKQIEEDGSRITLRGA